MKNFRSTSVERNLPWKAEMIISMGSSWMRPERILTIWWGMNFMTFTWNMGKIPTWGLNFQNAMRIIFWETSTSLAVLSRCFAILPWIYEWMTVKTRILRNGRKKSRRLLIFFKSVPGSMERKRSWFLTGVLKITRKDMSTTTQEVGF